MNLQGLHHIISSQSYCSTLKLYLEVILFLEIQALSQINDKLYWIDKEKLFFHQHNNTDIILYCILNTTIVTARAKTATLVDRKPKLMPPKRKILAAWLCCTFTIHTDRMCIIAVPHHACLHAWWKGNGLHTTETEKRFSRELLLPHECVTAIWKKALKYSIWWF